MWPIILGVLAGSGLAGSLIGGDKHQSGLDRITPWDDGYLWKDEIKEQVLTPFANIPWLTGQAAGQAIGGATAGLGGGLFTGLFSSLGEGIFGQMFGEDWLSGDLFGSEQSKINWDSWNLGGLNLFGNQGDFTSNV